MYAATMLAAVLQAGGGALASNCSSCDQNVEYNLPVAKMISDSIKRHRLTKHEKACAVFSVASHDDEVTVTIMSPSRKARPAAGVVIVTSGLPDTCVIPMAYKFAKDGQFIGAVGIR